MWKSSHPIRVITTSVKGVGLPVAFTATSQQVFVMCPALPSEGYPVRLLKNYCDRGSGVTKGRCYCLALDNLGLDLHPVFSWMQFWASLASSLLLPLPGVQRMAETAWVTDSKNRFSSAIVCKSSAPLWGLLSYLAGDIRTKHLPHPIAKATTKKA